MTTALKVTTPSGATYVCTVDHHSPIGSMFMGTNRRVTATDHLGQTTIYEKVEDGA